MKKSSVFLIIFIVALASTFSVISTMPILSSNIKVAMSYILYYGEPLGTPGTDSYNITDYEGIHWYDGPHTAGIPTDGIKYYVNTGSSAMVAAVKAAFETWDAQVEVELFNNDVRQLRTASGNKFDGKNVVSWSRLKSGIVAVCFVWYYSDSLEIVEFGIVFNSLYKWGVDPDGEGPRTINAFDIQNVATHEAGHALSLNDLYMVEASELTMYGYTSKGEAKKRSLGAGDVFGVQLIYKA
ncbi:MAG: hypothetical protein QXH91_05415 [Candidatus Bathyarchaeia archaeon]